MCVYLCGGWYIIMERIYCALKWQEFKYSFKELDFWRINLKDKGRCSQHGLTRFNCIRGTHSSQIVSSGLSFYKSWTSLVFWCGYHLGFEIREDQMIYDQIVPFPGDDLVPPGKAGVWVLWGFPLFYCTSHSVVPQGGTPHPRVPVLSALLGCSLCLRGKSLSII